MKLLVPVVIANHANGFAVTPFLHEVLESRGWPRINKLTRCVDGNWRPESIADLEDIRSDSVFVEVVKEHYQAWAASTDTWAEKVRYEQKVLNGLIPIEVTVLIEFEEEGDRERVTVRGGRW